MGRALALIYGVVVYALMFLTFLYLFAFLPTILVPKSVDTGMATSSGKPTRTVTACDIEQDKRTRIVAGCCRSGMTRLAIRCLDLA